MIILVKVVISLQEVHFLGFLAKLAISYQSNYDIFVQPLRRVMIVRPMAIYVECLRNGVVVPAI